MSLRPCPNCTEHIFESTVVCPHCEAPLVRSGSSTARSIGAAALLGLALSGCSDGGGTDTDTGEAVALYGVPDTGMYVDEDGDGVSEMDGDCDDGDASIHPGAEETPDDGIDSNCDGEDNT
ncbi:MAG: putative metal-binding motif-containing protein [Myxococcota bacterium]|nr:putative metal-binding motif-containing protein [Myxococcota bacterium]